MTKISEIRSGKAYVNLHVSSLMYYSGSVGSDKPNNKQTKLPILIKVPVAVPNTA